MVAGEKRRLWIPEALAYKGKPGDPQGMLVFDVELLAFTPPPTAPPPDVKAAPADAKKTAERPRLQGRSSRAPARRIPAPTEHGHRALHRLDDRRQDVRQLGRRAAQPATFRSDGVIAGWTEGVQLMVEGEKTRFWIPEDLAYKGQSARRTGMLVFDVELIKIQ